MERLNQVADHTTSPVICPEADSESLLCQLAEGSAASLLVIPPFEQAKRSYTLGGKQGPLMYATAEKKDVDHSNDDLVKKEDVRSYTPKRVIAPPEYPFTYYHLQRGQE